MGRGPSSALCSVPRYVGQDQSRDLSPRAKARGDLEFRFFVATLDLEQTETLATRMRTLGYKTSVETLDVGHMQAAEPQTETVDSIVELARSE